MCAAVRRVSQKKVARAVRQGYSGAIDVAAAMSSSRKLVKKEIDGGNLALPDDYEIGSGVSRRVARAARHPPDPTAIAHLLRRGDRLISEIRMSSLDHVRDAADLVATAVNPLVCNSGL
jgi:hypothetical protein